MLQPLKISKKTDNDAKLAQIIKENIPTTEYIPAEEFNAIVGKINEMVPAINVSNGGFQGTLSINEKRVDSGFYIPTESGTFINADNVVVDLSQGINFVSFDGDKWEVAVVPIIADGKIEEGNSGFVNGGTVDASLKPLINKSKISDFFVGSSDTSGIDSNAILSFKLHSTADINPDRKYFLRHFYNKVDKTLIQIVNDNNDIVAQYFTSTNGLSDISVLELNNLNVSNLKDLPFATIVVNPHKMPKNESSGNFFYKLELNVTSFSTNFMGVSYIIPSAIVNIEINNRAVSFTIPKNTRVVSPSFNYLTIDSQVISKDVSTPVYIVYNRFDNIFELIDISSKYKYQKFIYLGLINTFGNNHVQFFNSTMYSINGVRQNEFKVEAKAVYDTYVVPKNYSFWLDPKHNTFNYNSIIRLEAIDGDYRDLLELDGVTPKRLFITFMRFRKFDGTPTTDYSTNIFQIGSMVNEDAGVNIGVVSSWSSISPEDNSIKGRINFMTSPSNNTTLRFSVIIDLSKINVNNSSTLKTGLEIDTRLFIEQLKSKSTINGQELKGKTIVCFGDSVTENSTYPKLIQDLTSAKVYNVGFGGCRMGGRSSTHPTSLAYNEMAMYKVSEAVATRDFTAMENAAEYLKNNASDNNTAIVERLKNIDFNLVDIVTIFYGTNDFSGNDATIGDNNSLDIMTIKGATNLSIQNLLTAYPHLKILIITPTHRFNNIDLEIDSDNWINNQSLKLIDFSDALVEIADFNHIESYDMYRKSGLNKYNHAIYFNDGVHPNDIGGQYLADKIIKKLKTM